MGLALALIVMGVLIFLERAGMGYGLRDGWPWVVIALGVGGVLRNRRSFPGWMTMIIGILILGEKYYSIHFSVPNLIRVYFLPVLLIFLGLLWIWKYKKE